jgi:hypothetical protein
VTERVLVKALAVLGIRPMNVGYPVGKEGRSIIKWIGKIGIYTAGFIAIAEP